MPAMTEAEQRAAVLTEASAWLSTPYHPHGRVRGAGVDCLTLLVEVYGRAGILSDIDVPNYSPQWHLHHSEELYLIGIGRHCVEVSSPQPGDIAVFKFG